MSCQLDKYTSYEVSEVVRDGSRWVARLAHPPASCPDGVLNNSHTVLREHADVRQATLGFSTKLGAPVLMVPGTVEVSARVDPVEVKDDGHSAFFFIVILLVVAVVAWLLWRWFVWATATDLLQGVDSRQGFRGGNSYPSGGGASHTTVVRSGGGSGDLALGMVLGQSMAGSRGYAPPAPAPSAPSSYGGGSSSYGSDATSSPSPSPSYGSDSSSSGSSYGSDSSSSFGSDSSSSFGSDSGGGGGSFGSD